MYVLTRPAAIVAAAVEPIVLITRLPSLGNRQISDEGRGCNPLVKALGGGGGGPGERVRLTSMHERISLLGGELRIKSRPGAGTSVIAEVPLPASSEEEGRNEHNTG
jgi:glucose-6-phosphate-specific signal transduction histidine kinase